MNRVTIIDKTFETSIAEADILRRVGELGRQISEDYAGKRPLLLGVLNGAFIFAADLMRRMIEQLGTRHPASISVCTLFVKPDKLEAPLDIRYAAFQIPNDFIVGYGLDYDQQGRGLRDICTLVAEK